MDDEELGRGMAVMAAYLLEKGWRLYLYKDSSRLPQLATLEHVDGQMVGRTCRISFDTVLELHQNGDIVPWLTCGTGNSEATIFRHPSFDNQTTEIERAENPS